MISDKVISYIKDVTGLKVYYGIVPETAELPAASFFITSANSEGSVSGGVDLRRFSIQVDIVSRSCIESESFIDKFQKVENMPYKDIFKLCRIQDVQLNRPSDSNESVFLSSVDIEFTPYLK